MLPSSPVRRSSSRWLALAGSVLALLLTAPAYAAQAASAPAPAAPATADLSGPTTPQNLRATYVDGVFAGITWDPSIFAGGSIWYHVHADGYGVQGPLWSGVFHTTITLRELVESAYLDLGRTYTFTVVAWGNSAGTNRASGRSNLLTVTLPDTQTW